VSVQLGVGHIGELGCEGGNGLPVAFECLAFVVGEVELFEHLLDSALDLEELSFGGVLGEVEGAAGAGEAVGALGEEVVAPEVAKQALRDEGHLRT
jgi:hypothetical protein